MVDRALTPPAKRATRLGIIRQNTRIELDEHGVAAAAATVIGGISATFVAPRFPHRTVVFDRPFAFSIVENGSTTLLFTGVLVSPVQPVAD